MIKLEMVWCRYYRDAKIRLEMVLVRYKVKECQD